MLVLCLLLVCVAEKWHSSLGQKRGFVNAPRAVESRHASVSSATQAWHPRWLVRIAHPHWKDMPKGYRCLLIREVRHTF